MSAIDQDPAGVSFRGRQPATLAFGTSGLRGLVADITDLEAYVNARGFLDYLLEARLVRGDATCVLAGDLRPSTERILRAVAAAVADAGLSLEYAGAIPSPALACHALEAGWPSIMVTGSHIPFDRNGIKFNRPDGEVLKDDEPGILAAVARIRRLEYGRPESASRFATDGMFKAAAAPVLPAPSGAAARTYRARLTRFFEPGCLYGLRVLFYQHSAVGRELVPEILRELGADVVCAGRSSEFVAIDTEALAPAQLASIQALLDAALAAHGRIDAVVSTDGDSDRPLLLGVDPSGQASFVGGDVLGLLVAEALNADAICVPVSATDAIERWFAPRGVPIRRTRIGSPWVIAGMRAMPGRRRVGWEANGGFLTDTDIECAGRVLRALPTRDAALPLVAGLAAAARAGTLAAVVARLPARYGAAGLIDGVPGETSRALVEYFAPRDGRVRRVDFTADTPVASDAEGLAVACAPALAGEFARRRDVLARVFDGMAGFAPIASIDYTDGIRIGFANGDVAHLRPSGNAPQLRIYALADSAARAHEIVRLGIAEPDGLLRRLERLVDEERYVAAIERNIAYTDSLFAAGAAPPVIGTVSGSEQAATFWQALLDDARAAFGARLALSFHEDLPVNQAFGIVLLWERLRPLLRDGEGALVAFVFGEGTRSTPFTETDNAQKPAIASFVRAGRGTGRDYLSMVELALRYFAPVERYLHRSGFEGIVIKWGDEVQIPVRDLSGHDPLFAGADVVRFVSLRAMTAEDAANKDWVGVAPDGRVTQFIPRRPLPAMAALAERGLLQRRGDTLWGGINLGSIALSRRLLDALAGEFGQEVHDPTADRRRRPDLDPQFFTALTIAAIEDPGARADAWRTVLAENGAMRALERDLPGVLERLVGVLGRYARAHGRAPRMVALDFGDQYWGDIGQHTKIYEFYTALRDPGAAGRIARALAGCAGARADARGNVLVGECVLSPHVEVRDSVLVDVRLSGRGTISGSVLIGTRARDVRACDAFDVQSVVRELDLAARAGSYKVVSAEPVRVAAGERVTTLFIDEDPAAALLMRVAENTDLRDRAATYDVPILGNPIAFATAHERMGRLTPDALRDRRARAIAVVASML